MNNNEFNKIVQDMIDKCMDTLCKKGVEYGAEERFHNFKVAARLEGTTPIKALAGMMAKHTVSIYDMCRECRAGADYPPAMWDEKIGDHINYLLLLRALVAEGVEKATDRPDYIVE
jgi:hypothetical protein